ncbi:MAG: F0F1 ATP synthase subunit delta [Actinomycetota bacterium]|nr:F0F1 ATP synthase subunit delta [Actinomycetota bacterium]
MERRKQIFKNRAGAEITAAVRLEGGLKEKAEQAVRLKGVKGDIKITTDPSILGGLIIKVGNTVYDFSLATRLKSLAKTIKRRWFWLLS